MTSLLRSFKIAGSTLLLTLALPASAAITLNLQDAELSTLISTVSEATGKNFIVDPRVKGKVTVISAKPMSPEGLYQTFLAVLQVQGFAAIPAGPAIKLVPEGNARTDGGVPNGSGAGLPIDGVVTHVYQVQNISAAQLVPILRPLIPQWGHLAAYTASNMLIISDRAANVVRLEALIKQMDQGGDRDVDVVKLKNAAASEVVRMVSSLTQQDKQTEPGTRNVIAIADERTNSILLSGDKSDRQKYASIIADMDSPLKDDGATQVVYLHYASAENLAPILQGYAQQVSQASKSSSYTPATTATAAPVISSSGSGGNENLRILADKETNALVITAPPKIMRQVRDVISQLDIQRAQVLVEAIIAEVSADKSSQLGVDWAVYNRNRVVAADINSPATLNTLANAVAAGSGNAFLGLIGQGLNIGLGRDGGPNGSSFAALLKALKGDGDSNLLSTPTLVTLDNQEAKFSVGQEVPFLTGQYSNTGGSTGNVTNPFQTIERKDVGLTLGVTPQINEGNHVKLKINLESSSLTADSSNTLQQVTNKRTLSNTVGVEDGQILVIGGLIDDNLTDSNSGIPFLSDIPLLGHLFKSQSVIKKKRNLMLFIRPTILRKTSEGDYYSRRKYDSVRQAQIDTGVNNRETPLIGGPRPLLEPYESKRTAAEPVRPQLAPTEPPAAAIQEPAAESSAPPPAPESPATQPAAPGPAPAAAAP
jgi:general secretion pathway protein D